MMEETIERIQHATYGSYKDSGVEWLGKVPEHWDVIRLGNKFKERNEKVSDKDFPPLSVTKQGVVPQLENAAKSKDSNNRKLVKVSDFVINSRSDRKGSSGLSNLEGSVSLINTILKPNGIIPKFAHYLLKSHGFVEEFYRNGHGIVADLWTTRYSEMKIIKLAIPAQNEQDRIVALLDKKTTQIDQTIAQKERLIELLNERRQIVIHKAVTRGLNPDVPTKDSGVEWIGDIPEHWEMKRLKWLVDVISNKTISKNSQLNYIGMENIESWTGNYVQTDSDAEGQANIFEAGDVLFGKLRPYLAKVYHCQHIGLCSGEFLVLRSKDEITESFLQNILLSFRFIDLINSSTYGAKMPRANWSFIGNQEIPMPPKNEQEEIVNHIHSYTETTDKAIGHQIGEIKALEEYKKTIINATVTGKIKV